MDASQPPPIQQPFPQYAPPKKNNTVWIVLAVCAVGFCVCVPMIAAVLFPVFSQARSAARTAACVSNSKQLALSALMYATDNNDAFPPPDKWMAAVMPYQKRLHGFQCPAVDRTSSGSIESAPTTGSGLDTVIDAEFGYAFNANLKGKSTQKADPDCVMIFDSANLAWNAHDPVTSYPSPPRHVKKVVTALADGSVKARDVSALPGLKITP